MVSMHARETKLEPDLRSPERGEQARKVTIYFSLLKEFQDNPFLL